MTQPGQAYLERVKKVIIVVICLSIIVFSLGSLILSFFFLDAYRSFEENEMLSRMDRFSDNLNNSMKQIERTVYDYAFWDDMALFSDGEYPDFPGQGMSQSSFIAIGIDIVGIFDRDGNQLYADDYSNPQQGIYPFRPELEVYLKPDSPLFSISPDSAEPFSSVIFHHGNASGILVSHPILYHTTEKPGNGYVVMGRYFEGPFIEELSIFFKQPVQLLSPDEASSLNLIDSGREKDRDAFARVRNDTTISGFLKIPDPISGEDTFFQVTYPRDIYREGVSTLSTYLLLILGIMSVFTIVTILGIRFYLRHADTSAKIAQEKDYSYKKIIEEMEDAYFKATPEGIIEYVGPGTVKMLGYSDSSELVGKPLSVLYQNPDDRTNLRESLFSKHQLKNHPLVLKRKDGSLVFITTNVHLIYDDDGTVTGIEGIAHDNTEMLRAKKSADESDSFYRLIFESANIGLFQSSSEGGFSLVNPAFATMFGYAGPEQMRQEAISIVKDLGLTQEDRNHLLQDLNTGGKVQNLEFFMKKRDGTPIWLSCNIVSIRDIHEQLVAYFGTALDISEKKRIELELIASQQKFQSLFYFSPLAIIVYNEEGKLVDLNSAAISLFGSSEQSIPETEPLFYLAFLTPLQQEELKNGAVVRTEAKLDFDSLRKTYDLPPDRSGIRYLEMMITPIPHPNHGVGWYLVQIADITERKVAEIARNTATTRLKEAEVIARLGHWELDLKKDVLFWSDSVYQIFGRDPHEFVPSYESFTSLIHPEDRLMVDDAYKRHLRDHDPYDVIHRILHPDGLVKYVREKCNTEYDENGIAIRSVGIIHDITSIRASELALRESEQKYREMFSNVSLGLILFEFTNEGEPGRIIDANPRAEEMIQLSMQEIQDHAYHIQAFLPICGSSMVKDLTIIDTDICTFESGIIRGIDDILPVQVTLDIFRLEQTVVGLAIIEDITLKRQYEEERFRLIEQIEKNLAELSILNDGIRNPLTIIMMMVDELDEQISEPVIKQIRAIDELINQLDKRWIESDKILQYLQKHHHVRYK